LTRRPKPISETPQLKRSRSQWIKAGMGNTGLECPTYNYE